MGYNDYESPYFSVKSSHTDILHNTDYHFMFRCATTKDDYFNGKCTGTNRINMNSVKLIKYKYYLIRQEKLIQ